MIVSCFSDEIAPALADQIRVIRSLGMRYLEIRTVDDTGVMELDEAALRAVKEACDRNGLTITCVSSPIGKDRADIPLEKAVADVKRACDAADIFSCRYIRIFSFFKREIPEEEAFRLSLMKLKVMAEAARERGKVLVMESGKDTAGAKSADALKLFEAVSSPALRCAFDMAAFCAAGDEPFEESLPRLLPYIEYVHIKDMKRGASERVPAGEGDARVKNILCALRDRPLILSLEPHLAYAGDKRGFSGEGNFLKAHAALMKILKESGICYE